MRAQREVRCPECRGGRVCASAWEVWYARCDEAEASWAVETGSPEGFPASAAWAELVEERPGCEPDADCPACAGTGVVRPVGVGYAAA